MNTKKKRDAVAGLGFVLPSFVLLCLFIAFPIIEVFYYSLTNYNGNLSPEFVGLSNYARMFTDKAIGYALKNTLIYTVVSVPLLTLLSLGIAALLAQEFQNKFGSFVRSSMFIPVICSATLVATIWYYIFSSDATGVANMIIGIFGAEAIDFLGQETSALIIICFVMVWKDVGYYLVIYYAAMMDIPHNLYEAAAIDGATKWQQFKYITLPNLKGTSYLVVTLSTIYSFQVFDLAYNMTMGGPGYATTSLVFRVYVESFKNWKLGYGCAISVVILILIAIISGIQRIAFKEEISG